VLRCPLPGKKSSQFALTTTVFIGFLHICPNPSRQGK
jgi:hypothetical protein